MCMPLEALLVSLKTPSHCIKKLDQTLAQTIITGLIYTNKAWNTILRAYSKTNKPIQTLIIYNHFIQSHSIYPDKYTYPVIISASTRLHCVPKAKETHARVVKVGVDTDLYVQNALIHFYGFTGQLIEARRVFDRMCERDVTSWNTILGCYGGKTSLGTEMMSLFGSMVREGVRADRITMVILLTVCGQIRGLEFGRLIHGYVVKMGMQYELNIENALLDIYAKCGQMDALLKKFNDMYGTRDIVSYTVLINSYIETGRIDMAREIFDDMPEKDIVLWNSMIHGYVKEKRPQEALELLVHMENESVRPDENTIVSLLTACSSLSNLRYGRHIHRTVLRNNIKQDVFVETALINMYFKCGGIADAMIIFFKMKYKDVFTWTTTIEGLARSGFETQALKLFHQMERQGTRPNEATFVSTLTACRQAGLVDDGCRLFKWMIEVYGIQPSIEHFTSLVELLSKAGLLHQAEEFISFIVPKERLIAYKTLLSACMSYSEINLGLRIANKLLQLGSASHEVYVLLSNFYAEAGLWYKVEETRKVMKELNTRKQTGVSYIELLS
ncbi:putative pentatricopeptide repeat-containing protein At3g15930 [Apium graveolens]|uniref:putative pentatricopeptide repeat-containing protein At3g15930 n=1 Tax=Apium graveolens TaxID=4045 RepID=UPI003D79B1D5